MISVRFAPSPTGVPHLGGIRTALYNFLFARHNKGKFFLRIEDTDQKRLVEEAEDAILESLKWLGLDWDDQIVHQSSRLKIYKEHVDLLLEKKVAYEKDGAVWIKVSKEKDFSWTDLVGNKKITFKGESVEDFVILKSDGFPTYHLANVIDDHLMEITHVIRGEEWISSTPKHLFLYESFGWTPPFFAHQPVILGPDKGKLSKRHGAKSVLDYKKEGYLKETLLNYIATLGWTPRGDNEIYSLEEMIKLFDIKDINTSNPKFDSVKLEWMNGLYIRNLPNDKLEEEIREISPEINDLNKEEFSKFLEIAKTRIKTLLEFSSYVLPLIKKSHTLTNEEEVIAKELMEEFSKVSNWNKEEILKALKEVILKKNIKMSQIYKVLLGSAFGLPLPEALEILGKEKTIKLLK